MESQSEPRKEVPRELHDMFRPPVNRAMRTLDRSFFRKTVPISAAKVFQNSDISNVRKELSGSRDLLALPRMSSIHDAKEPDGLMRKALLLREDVKHDGESEAIHGLVL